MRPVKPPDPNETALDRIINKIAPQAGVRRYRARLMLAMAGSYTGAQKTRRGTKEWNPLGYDPDTDILSDLPTLRSRSRDLIRNTPIATGAIGSSVMNVVGTGLKLQSRIDNELLRLTDEEADQWQDQVEREWLLFAGSQECDSAQTLDFVSLQSLAFRQALENGDVFCVMKRFARNNFPYKLKLQLIEADRVCNADNAPDKLGQVAGIKKDPKTGAPLEYHILNQHPLKQYWGVNSEKAAWEKVPAFGEKTGLRNVLHLYEMLRPGQTRGVPFIAPVIEQLKVLDRYTEAELMAAAVSALFTVFLQTESGDLKFDITTGMGAETGAASTDTDLKMGPGAIVGLNPGEKIEVADPKRPNTAFDPFVTAILVQIGASLGIPYEVLTRHFTSSYSASRAALLEAWRFFRGRRQWLVSTFCQPIYEIWLYEAIATGRVKAPGYFADPLIRRAYSRAVWIGDSPGYVDPMRDIGAAEKRVNLNISTLDEETARMTGGDFEENVRQLAKEKRMMEKAGLWPPPVVAGKSAKNESPDKEAPEDEDA